MSRSPFLVTLSLILFASTAAEGNPLSPVMGVDPPILDFGEIAVGLPVSRSVHLSNLSEDPHSMLRITSIGVNGEGFSIVHAPSLPATIPGDSSVAIMIRLRTSHAGALLGTLTIISPNAVNSPLNIPLLGDGRSTEARNGRFIVRFDSGVIAPGAPLDGPLSAFEFTCPELPALLEGAGVSRLVKLMPWFDPQDVHTTNQFGEEVILYDLSTIYVAHLSDPNGHAANAVVGLGDQECISYTELVIPGEVDFTPNDDHFEFQWGLHNTEQIPFIDAQPDIDINAPVAWDITHGSGGVFVAVLDTGLDSTHVDLVPGRTFNGPNFVYPGSQPGDVVNHGTPVTGILAATGSNQEEGVAGVAWPIKVINLKVCDDETNCDPEIAAAGVSWATSDDRVQIANCSFGVEPPLPGGDPPFYTLELAVRNLALSGKLLVASMGNATSSVRRFPAASPSAMAVGSVWVDGLRWEGHKVPGGPSNLASTFGPWIDVCAPGGSTIASLSSGGGYKLDDPPNASDLHTNWFGGTSASAPVVAGVAALLTSFRDDLDGWDLKQIIERTALDVDEGGAGTGHDVFTGWGIVRADTALKYVMPPKRSVQHLQETEVGEWQSINGWQITFLNLDNLGYNIPDGTYLCERQRITFADLWFEEQFEIPPDVWFRASGTSGWRLIGYGDTFDLLREYPSHATITNIATTRASTETYVYGVFDGPQFLGWVPCDPLEAKVAITAVGDLPASSLVGMDSQLSGSYFPRVSVVPNPSFGRTEFLVEQVNDRLVSLRIYDLNGRMIRALSTPGALGRAALRWDGRNANGGIVSSGVYFYELEVKETIRRGKLVITR